MKPLNQAVRALALPALLLSFSCSFLSCDDSEDKPAPVIESFTPESGFVGSPVTILGQNLAQVTNIKFNGTNAIMVTQSETSITTDVPAGAQTGKITLEYPSGSVTSANDFTVEIRTLVVSEFEEADADTRWGKAEDTGEIQISAIAGSGSQHYFQLKGSDVDGDYWVGGRYFGTAGSDVPFGIVTNDPAQVYYNVDIKSNLVNSPTTPPKAKLVFEVFSVGSPNNTKNWEIDFDVTWTNWRTISIRADKFHRWNGTGFDSFSGDINKAWVVALYLTGGSADVYDFSFDNVRFSEGAPLGDVINP